MNEWILIPAQPQTHKHPLNFAVLSAVVLFFLYCTVWWNFLQTTKGQLLLKIWFTAARYNWRCFGSSKSTSFFCNKSMFLLIVWEIVKGLFIHLFFFLQFWTQDGPLPAGCFLPASRLPASPETMLLGVQGRPGSRPSGGLQLPGGCRQRLVSVATFKQNYIQVSHVNLYASRVHLICTHWQWIDSVVGIWGVRVAPLLRSARRIEVFLHTSPSEGIL